VNYQAGFARARGRYYGRVVAHPCFAVAVADLRRGPIRVSWPVTVDWLRGALRGTEASPTESGTLEVELTGHRAQVVVRGQARVKVTLPCAVTLDPVAVELEPEIFLMLSPAPGAATPALQEPGRRGRRAVRRDRSAARSPSTGGSVKRKADVWGEDPSLTDELAAGDCYDGEQVVLDDFLREFLLLELPMIVRRSDLPLAEDAAIRPPSGSEEAALRAAPDPDPRLLPLAAIADRLRQTKE
jgi:uncharacterized protein